MEWLRRARSNLNQARAGSEVEGVYLEDLCFSAQQAAEKAIKGLCVARGLAFPHVHDLVALLTLLQRDGATVPEPVKDAGRLTRFAVEARYPGIGEPVDGAEYESAVAIAAVVLDWAEELIEGRGDSPS